MEKDIRVKQMIRLLFFFAVVPLITYVLSEVPLLPVSGMNDWTGFWGSYLGAIISGCITLYVMHYTMEKEKEIQKSNEKLTRSIQERHEKIEFFDKLGADIARILQYTDKISAYIKHSTSNGNFIMTADYLNSVSEMYVTSNRLSLMLMTRNDVYDLFGLKYAYNELIKEMMYLKNAYASICESDSKDSIQILELSQRDILHEKTVFLREVIENVTYRNLYENK